MHPQLTALTRQLDAASDDARQIAGTLDVAALTRRPRPGMWSVADCLSHLSKSTEVELAALDEGLTRRGTPPRAGDDRPFKMDLLGRFLAWGLEPPPRFWSKLRTTKELEPALDAHLERALSEFLVWQDEIKARLTRVQGLALDRIRVVSPFDRRFSYNALSLFHILLAHERRHLWQARQALK